MVWGGSLNKEGSDYLRKIRDVDKVIAFLDNIKEDLTPEDQVTLSRAIEIIVDYVSKISERGM